MKKIIFVIMLAAILFPTITSADSMMIEMVNLTLIDQDTQSEIRTDNGLYGVKGDLTIRCYGYKWKELGYGQGFDDKPPVNYTPEEVYTIKDYYKNSYGLIDLSSYIKFITIDYCNLELASDEGAKYLGEKYNLNFAPEKGLIVDRNNCHFSEDIIQGEICKMEVAVKKVNKFDWESDVEEDDCPKTICPVDDVKPIETESKPEDTVKNQNTTPKQLGLWGQVRCWIIGWLGGKC